MDSLAEEMHEQVYNLVERSKCHDVVSVILDIHVLEDEQMVKTIKLSYLILIFNCLFFCFIVMIVL